MMLTFIIVYSSLLVFFLVAFFISLMDGNLIGSTWDFVFDDRIKWKDFNDDEKTFIGFLMTIFSPLVYSLLLIGILIGVFISFSRGFKSLMFKHRSKAFNELKDKLGAQ